MVVSSTRLLQTPTMTTERRSGECQTQDRAWVNSLLCGERCNVRERQTGRSLSSDLYSNLERCPAGPHPATGTGAACGTRGTQSSHTAPQCAGSSGCLLVLREIPRCAARPLPVGGSLVNENARPGRP